MGILYACITVAGWGLWLVPSQNIPFKNQNIKTLYITGTAMVAAFLVALSQNQLVTNPGGFWLPFTGGLIWAVSGLCAFTGTHKIGMAKAYGIWAPINIIISILWGALLFKEFPNMDVSNFLLLVFYLALIISGVLMIILSKGGEGQSRNKADFTWGVLGAVGAGFLWGSYVIPIKLSQVSAWASAFPLTVGMFVGSVILTALNRQSPRLNNVKEYRLVILSGILWVIGNYGMLLLVETFGAGRGFTIAQLSVVLGAIVGIYFLKDPKPHTKAASLTLAGCVLATIGGILLGNLS